ncbi:hypothetical protein LTS18_010925, partial [Coniosporium uncinatum]
MNHIGVVKTLWQAKLLPRIISGASAGSIVASVLCTKTDAEVPSVLDEFCHGDLAVFEKEGEEDGVLRKAARFLKYGALFEINHLVRVMRDMLGDLTFQEAYNRTRRVLNISVSSEGLYELPRLLNYITAPNVMIWSAVAASCSVPFIFSAASLQAKDPKTGLQVPWNPSPQRWMDGSVDNDLPMNRLAEMFNVNHFIVSQVNPHVVPFLAREEGTSNNDVQQMMAAVDPGSSWLHTMASLAKGEALHRMHVLAELGVFPTYLTKVRSILAQRYSGDITILPEINYAQFPKVLSNPTTEFMLAAMLGGERATWPKLSRIQNHCAIELALDEAVQKLRAHVVFSPSQVDLRLSNYSYQQEYFKLRASSSHGGSSAMPQATRFSVPSTPRTAIPKPMSEPRAGSLRPRKSLQLRIRKSDNGASYLSPHLRISAADALSSSADEDRNADLEHDATVGVASSNVESEEDDSTFSSESPPDSPDQAPTLWPSTRQVLFPSASQPATPFYHNRRNSAGFGSKLSMTPSNSSQKLSREAFDVTTSGPSAVERSQGPSSPELRYKRLFHDRPVVSTPLPSEMTLTPASPEARRGRRQSSKAS